MLDIVPAFYKSAADHVVRPSKEEKARKAAEQTAASSVNGSVNLVPVPAGEEEDAEGEEE